MEELRRQLAAATKKYEATATAHAVAAEAAREVIIRALRAGMTPTEVARRSPFTSAYIRKLARERGLPPAPPGPKPKPEKRS